MTDKIFLELVSPEKLVASLEVDEVLATGVLGEFGVLPGHAALLTSLRAGEFMYKLAGKEERYLLSGGFFQVSDDKVIVLSERCEKFNEINAENAKQLKADIEKYLADNKDILDEELLMLQTQLEYQNKRIELASKK